MLVDRDHSRTLPPFGQWLLHQASRQDAIGELARAAADRAFPRGGDFRAVSKRLNETGAGGEMHAALEDAELDYHEL